MHERRAVRLVVREARLRREAVFTRLGVVPIDGAERLEDPRHSAGKLDATSTTWRLACARQCPRITASGFGRFRDSASHI
jgi:hypothetical protein